MDELQIRMASLSISELQAIIDAPEGQYTPIAREAAQLALAAKPVQRDHGSDIASPDSNVPPPPFRNADMLALAAQWLLAMSITIHIVVAVYALITSGDTKYLSIIAPTNCSSAGGLILIDLPTCIVFCCWWYRIAANLPALNAEEVYSPSASVWAFFIPFINIVRPARVGQEIWKASDPSLAPNNASTRSQLLPSSLVSRWWTSLVVAGLLRSCYLDSRPMSIPDYSFVSISYVLFATAGMAAIRLIGQVQQRQNARWNNIALSKPEIKLEPTA